MAGRSLLCPLRWLVPLAATLLLAHPAAGAPPTPEEEQEIERELFGEDQSTEEEGPSPDEVVLQKRPRDLPETSLSRQDRTVIRRRGAEDVASLVEALSSAHITRSSRGQRKITLRGFKGPQVRVLVDGLPGALPDSGILDLSLIPALMIHQVTVAKGVAPSLLPAGALGGAVNIITRRAGQGPLAAARLEHGAYQSWRAAAEHSMELGGVAYTVYAGLYHQDASGLSRDFLATPNERPALRANSDRLDWHAGAALRYRISQDHALLARVSYIDGERGIPPSTQSPRPEHLRLGAWRAVAATVRHQGSIDRVELDEAVYLRLHQRRLEVYDSDALESQAAAGSGDAGSAGLSVGGRARGRTWVDGLPWGLTFVRLTLAADHDRFDGELPGGASQPTRSRTTLSAAPEFEAMLSPCWSITAGFSVDLELPDGGDTSVGWGPLISALYAPLESMALRGTVARRTRFPTLEERFGAAGGTLISNPELGPESAWHLGLEATWRLLPGIELRGGVFDAEVLDLIIQEPTAGGAVQLTNAASGRYVGLEVGFKLSPFDQLRLSAAYSLLYARRTDDQAPDELLPGRPMNKASMELVFAPLRFVKMGTFLLVHGERSYLDPGTGSWGSLSPYAVWNALISVQPVTWGSVFVRATNILGTHHVTEYGFPEPGRRIWLGLDFNYDRS